MVFISAQEGFRAVWALFSPVPFPFPWCPVIILRMAHKRLTEDFRAWAQSEIEKHLILGSGIGDLPWWLRSAWRGYRKATGGDGDWATGDHFRFLGVGQGYVKVWDYRQGKRSLTGFKARLNRYAKQTGKRFRQVQCADGVQVLRVR